MIGINIFMNDDIILNEYLQGKSANAITKEYKIQYRTIRKLIEEKGHVMRTHSKANSKYTFNHNFFDNISQESRAYFLGLILTDGYVGDRDVVLELKSVDKHIIESFVKFIDGNNKIHTIERKGNSYSKKGCITSRLNFHSDKMIKDLKKLGIKRGKTYNVNIPKIPENMEKHFWRGVLDGDGYVSCLKRIHKYNISSGEARVSRSMYLEVGICGHMNTVTAFAEFLTRNNIMHSKIFPDHTIFSIRLKNATEALKFLELIYTDSDPKLCLKRKYTKYQEYLKYKLVK